MLQERTEKGIDQLQRKLDEPDFVPPLNSTAISTGNTSADSAHILISSVVPDSIASLTEASLIVCTGHPPLLPSAAVCASASIGRFAAGITCGLIGSSCQDVDGSTLCSCVAVNISNSALMVYAAENMR
jgi:hypothetical protein